MAAFPEKPTILLIPGAFTTPACYDFLGPRLESAGHNVVRASLMTTTPADPHSCTAEQEGSHLLESSVRPLVQAGKEIIVFAHSLGATVCSGAGAGLTKAERVGEGKKGGILGLIWISCAFPKEGASQLEFLGGQWPPFCKLDRAGPGLLVFDDPINLLYNDVDDKSLQTSLEKSHVGTATSSFTTPVKAPLWTDPTRNGRRVYLLTTQDHTFPAAAQRMFVEGSGVDWDVQEINGGHCAFISTSERVAETIVEAAERWGEMSS